MPEKIDYYSSYGQKLITLFAKLLFSGESHSLIELSERLRCSKQTVLRLVDDIRRSYGVDIEDTIRENRKYYRMKTNGRIPPALNLTRSEYAVLFMCQAFARHLLGEKIFEEATTALEKNRALVSSGKGFSPGKVSSFIPGTIDYTPHEECMRKLLQALEENMVCRVTYKGLGAKKAKKFTIMPLKVFSHHETVYLHARLTNGENNKKDPSVYDPLLAVHRIQRIELTDKRFDYPVDYDFEKIYNRHFGVMSDDLFDVVADFSGDAAAYVAERMWSPDQKITKRGSDGIRITFSASSEPELISWLLSFGDKAKLIKPERLADQIKAIAENVCRAYS